MVHIWYIWLIWYKNNPHHLHLPWYIWGPEHRNFKPRSPVSMGFESKNRVALIIILYITLWLFDIAMKNGPLKQMIFPAFDTSIEL